MFWFNEILRIFAMLTVFLFFLFILSGKENEVHDQQLKRSAHMIELILLSAILGEVSKLNNSKNAKSENKEDKKEEEKKN